VRERYESERELWQPHDHLGALRSETAALDWHLERVLGLEDLDRAAIRRRGLRAVVDGCASVGGLAVPPLLRALGVEVIELDCVPDGRFTRELEPLPEPRRARRAVRGSGADFGIALDPTPIAPPWWTRRACRWARSTRSRSASRWRWRGAMGRW